MYPEAMPTADQRKNQAIVEDYLSSKQISGENGTPIALTKGPVNDYLLHVDKENCPRFGKLRKLAAQREEYLKVMGYFHDKYKMKLEKLIGKNITDWEDMLSYCGYLEWSSYSSVDLIFKPTSLDYKYCFAMGDTKQYTTSFGTDELWKISDVEFLKNIRDYAN